MFPPVLVGGFGTEAVERRASGSSHQDIRHDRAILSASLQGTTSVSAAKVSTSRILRSVVDRHSSLLRR